MNREAETLVRMMWRAAIVVVAGLIGASASSAQTFPGSDLPSGYAPAAAPAAPPSVPAAAAPSTPPTRVAAPAGPPAKQLFGAAREAAPLAARAIGFYSRGCLAGARSLAIDGPTWQAMRLSRNRTWGHPTLVALVEKLAGDAQRLDGWPGLLVGDLSQPRGGPMLTGHESHQIGLDADVWLTPMPGRRLTAQEREELSATSMLGADQLHVDPKVWTDAHVRVIKRAATYPEVERVLVHPGIKKALCAAEKGQGAARSWLYKVRPYWGHHYHMHIRVQCPAGSPDCRPQPPAGQDDGCDKELVDWFALLTRPPDPGPPKPPKPPLTLGDLPAECRLVLDAGAAKPAPLRAGAASRPQ